MKKIQLNSLYGTFGDENIKCQRCQDKGYYFPTSQDPLLTVPCECQQRNYTNPLPSSNSTNTNSQLQEIVKEMKDIEKSIDGLTGYNPTTLYGKRAKITLENKEKFRRQLIQVKTLADNLVRLYHNCKECSCPVCSFVRDYSKWKEENP